MAGFSWEIFKENIGDIPDALLQQLREQVEKATSSALFKSWLAANGGGGLLAAADKMEMEPLAFAEALVDHYDREPPEGAGAIHDDEGTDTGERLSTEAPSVAGDTLNIRYKMVDEDIQRRFANKPEVQEQYRKVLDKYGAEAVIPVFNFTWNDDPHARRSVGGTDHVERLAEENPKLFQRLMEFEVEYGSNFSTTFVGGDDGTGKEFDGMSADEIYTKGLRDAYEKFLAGRGSGRVYNKPDRREVRDMVRGTLAGLVGSTYTDSELERYTDLFMRDHRRAFDNPSAGLSPRASVLEQIRKREDYKRIHTLRPEGVDEDQWLPTYQNAASRQGFAGGAADDFAETQAAVGGDLTRIDVAAATSQFAATGKKRPEIFDQFRSSASRMMRRVR